VRDSQICLSVVFSVLCALSVVLPWSECRCDAEDYRTKPRGPDDRKERAQVIFKKFLRPGAEHEIFLDDDTRQKIAQTVEADDPVTLPFFLVCLLLFVVMNKLCRNKASFSWLSRSPTSSWYSARSGFPPDCSLH